MSETTLSIPEPIFSASLRPESLSALIWRRFRRHRLALISAIILVFMILLVASAPLTGYTPTEQNTKNEFAKPSTTHLFGTDELGRDVFTRILHGGRISLAVGIVSSLLSLLVGVIVGAVSGYYGGWIDNVLMRITDTFLIMPVVFVLILFSALLRESPALAGLRSSVWLVIFAVSAFAWMWPARIARGLCLVLRERDFVSASRALGASDARLIFQRILPNSIGPLLVSATLQMAFAIITESGLSYLGFGIQPPTPSWGNILESAQVHVYRAPWLAVFPGLMIFITVMAINFIGDGLRDAFDPYVVHEK
ncbi:MAG TPA: ABC transporter permease [Anaerolineales bacterium]|nr:ABC transporter permease [Anaerolineales bacterium]